MHKEKEEGRIGITGNETGKGRERACNTRKNKEESKAERGEEKGRGEREDCNIRWIITEGKLLIKKLLSDPEEIEI